VGNPEPTTRFQRIAEKRARDARTVPTSSRPWIDSEVRLMDDRPRYMISVAAEFVGMHPQTLRIYETKGLVRPKRTPGNTRLYSESDLQRLRLIQRLTTELGLNLAGVETVLRLEDEVRRLQARIERLEREMRDGLRQVHRQYRRDVVLFDGGKTTLPEPSKRR
jgi:MerR family transcriptional regulator/heat shock protein HspR